MQIREALISQSPSLALQRAAADEIARLDALVGDLRGLAEHYHSQLDFFDPQQPLDLEDTRV